MSQGIQKKVVALAQNKLINTSLKNSIQVIIRTLIGFLNIKIIASLVGPNGMAFVGQLQNALLIGSNLSGLGITNGVIKYLAQYKHSASRRALIITTSLIVTIIVSCLLGVFSFLFSSVFSVLIFNTSEYALIIKFIGVFFITNSLVNLFLAYLNGLQYLKSYIKFNVLLSVSGFIISFLGVYFWGLNGLLWSQILVSLIAFLYISFMYKNHLYMKKLVISFSMLKKLGNYSLMAIVSGTLAPLTFFVIRKIIVADLSWETAGFWDGINKVSNNYIGLITSSFIFYFLPTFSQLRTSNEIRTEVKSTYKNLVPLLIIGAITIYLSRNLIIKILFTEAFRPMSDLFFWQVIGDFFKILSWVIGYLFLAKEKVKVFISTEVISVLLQISLAKLFISLNANLTMYYGIENILYFSIMYICYVWHFKPVKSL
jgi:PST family polysaccharide transporter